MPITPHSGLHIEISSRTVACYTGQVRTEESEMADFSSFSVGIYSSAAPKKRDI